MCMKREGIQRSGGQILLRHRDMFLAHFSSVILMKTNPNRNDVSCLNASLYNNICATFLPAAKVH